MSVLTPDQIEAARQMRAEGMSWSATAKALGTRFEIVRRSVDPEWGEQERRKNTARKALTRPIPFATRIEGGAGNLSSAQLARMQRRLPPDTRHPMQVLLGDPRPGRELMEVGRG